MYHADARNMLAQVVLREIDIALYIVQQLFQPFLTMHIGSSRTDIGQHVPFAELARFHELLKTVADVLIEDNGVRTSQSRHIECFAGCHEGEGILRGSPRNSSKRMVFVRWQSQVGMNFIGDDKRMAFRTNISNPA